MGDLLAALVSARRCLTSPTHRTCHRNSARNGRRSEVQVRPPGNLPPETRPERARRGGRFVGGGGVTRRRPGRPAGVAGRRPRPRDPGRDRRAAGGRRRMPGWPLGSGLGSSSARAGLQGVGRRAEPHEPGAGATGDRLVSVSRVGAGRVVVGGRRPPPARPTSPPMPRRLHRRRARRHSTFEARRAHAPARWPYAVGHLAADAGVMVTSPPQPTGRQRLQGLPPATGPRSSRPWTARSRPGSTPCRRWRRSRWRGGVRDPRRLGGRGLRRRRGAELSVIATGDGAHRLHADARRRPACVERVLAAGGLPARRPS